MTKRRCSIKSFAGDVDLGNLVHVGLAFGADVGNPPGTIIYVDNVAFVGAPPSATGQQGSRMPTTYPQHWPFGSVAATAWFIFVELDMNPFIYNAPYPRE